MPDRNLKLLIVDDSPEDRTVVRYTLEGVAGHTWEFLEEEKGGPALARLELEDVDCILLDYRLPDMNAVDFLHELTRRFGPLRFPVVVFTGVGRPTLGKQLLEAGAQDYLSKDAIRADGLVRAIQASIKQVHLLREQQQQREQLEKATGRVEMLETALRKIPAPVLITDAEMDSTGPRIVFVNPAFTALTGYSEQDVIGKTPKLLQGPKTSRNLLARVRRNLLMGQTFSGQITYYRKDRSEFTMDLAIAPVRDTGGRITHFVASSRDSGADAVCTSVNRGKSTGVRGLASDGTLFSSTPLYRSATAHHSPLPIPADTL